MSHLSDIVCVAMLSEHNARRYGLRGRTHGGGSPVYLRTIGPWSAQGTVLTLKPCPDEMFQIG